jgi:hypothetical protein
MTIKDLTKYLLKNGTISEEKLKRIEDIIFDRNKEYECLLHNIEIENNIVGMDIIVKMNVSFLLDSKNYLTGDFFGRITNGQGKLLIRLKE